MNSTGVVVRQITWPRTVHIGREATTQSLPASPGALQFVGLGLCTPAQGRAAAGLRSATNFGTGGGKALPDRSKVSTVICRRDGVVTADPRRFKVVQAKVEMDSIPRKTIGVAGISTNPAVHSPGDEMSYSQSREALQGGWASCRQQQCAAKRRIDT